MSWVLFQNSLLFAGLATLLAVAAGISVAVFLFASGRRVRWAGITLAGTALALPPFLVVNCWLALFGETGPWRAWLPWDLYDLRTAGVVMGLMLWPIPMYATFSAWQRLQPAHLEMEPRLTGLDLLRRVLLPVAGPALTVATVLSFVLAMANFAVPTLFQTKVFTAEIWIRFSANFDHAGALVASLPVLGVLLLAWPWLRPREIPWSREQGAAAPRLVEQRLGTLPVRAAAVVSAVVVVASVVVPLGDLLLDGGTWRQLGPALAAGKAAFWNSFGLSAVAAASAMVIGLAIWRWRFGAALWISFLLPGVFLGLLLIWGLNRPPLIALYQGSGVVILALVVRYLGPAREAVRIARAGEDKDLVDAVRVAGGSRWQVFRYATWPQVRRPVLAGWYVIYLLCLWDIESLVLIAPPGLETLPLRIFNLLHYGHNPQVNALCLALLGLAVLPPLLWAGAATLRRVWPRPALGSGIALAAFMTLAAGGCSRSPEGVVTLDSRFFRAAEVLGTRGRGAGQFNKPRSLAVDTRDNFYVVDMTGRVQKFNRHGDFLLFWQMPQTDLGRPKGMVADTRGRILVVEPHYSRVNHFTPEGRLERQWGQPGTNAGQLSMPRAVAVNSRGEIWICEYGVTERVQRFTPDGGRLLAGFGGFGSKPGEFNRAEGMCVDRSDRLYVADSCNHRVQVFDPDGKWLRSLGQAGSGPGELSYPYDVQVDEHGTVFVCEFGNSRIQVFDADGRSLEIVGGPGAAPGRFSNPWSVALDTNGNLYVADAGNHRVQKLLAYPHRERLSAHGGVHGHGRRARSPSLGSDGRAVRLTM